MFAVKELVAVGLDVVGVGVAGVGVILPGAAVMLGLPFDVEDGTGVGLVPGFFAIFLAGDGLIVTFELAKLAALAVLINEIPHDITICFSLNFIIFLDDHTL